MVLLLFNKKKCLVQLSLFHVIPISLITRVYLLISAIFKISYFCETRSPYLHTNIFMRTWKVFWTYFSNENILSKKISIFVIVMLNQYYGVFITTEATWWQLGIVLFVCSDSLPRTRFQLIQHLFYYRIFWKALRVLVTFWILYYKIDKLETNSYSIRFISFYLSLLELLDQ